MTSAFTKTNTPAALLSLIGLCLPACNRNAASPPSSASTPITQATNTTIENAGFPRLAVLAEELRAKENAKIGVSTHESLRFGSLILEAWKSDLETKFGLKLGSLPSDNQQATDLLTKQSITRGFFIQAGFKEDHLSSGSYTGRLGVFTVEPIALNSEILSEIKIPGFALDPKRIDIKAYLAKQELSLSHLPFIATAVGIDSDKTYLLIINSKSFLTMSSGLCSENPQDSTKLHREFTKYVYLNEVSAAVLDQFFQSKGIKDYHDRDLKFGNSSGVKVTLGQIYEAFSDLVSWQNSDLPLWAHMRILGGQMTNAAPEAYKLTLNLQSDAVSTAINNSQELAQQIDKSFPSGVEVTFEQIIPLLKTLPRLDRELRRLALARLEEKNYSYLFSATKILQESSK